MKPVRYWLLVCPNSQDVVVFELILFQVCLEMGLPYVTIERYFFRGIF